jgi:signal transduction histidine kinase
MVDVTAGRILVCDDDVSTRFARVRALKVAGHTVFEAGRLSEASILLQEIKPEVLVLDVNLPDGNGIEFSRALKEDPALRSTMVLQMSASFVTSDDYVRGLDAGADAYLAEPAPPGVLLATVRALLRLGRTERALQDALRLEQAARSEAEAAREEAEAANRIKDDFLATLSHELRTPLHAIIGWVALLRTRPLDDEGRKRALEVVERNAKAQAALIEDLLDVSRITLGQLQLTWGSIDLAPVVSSAVESIRPTAETKGIAIEADVAIDPDRTVRGDATRLQQVFWNLLSNAVKFTPAGGQVTVRARIADGGAEVEVTDTGRGISAEFLPRMFDRFRRADRSSSGVDRGLGLGLAIARQLVELHGGTLTAASPGLNQGATFVVTLPVRSSDRAPQPTVSSTGTPS